MAYTSLGSVNTIYLKNSQRLTEVYAEVSPRENGTLTESRVLWSYDQRCNAELMASSNADFNRFTILKVITGTSPHSKLYAFTRFNFLEPLLIPINFICAISI